MAKISIFLIGFFICTAFADELRIALNSDFDSVHPILRTSVTSVFVMDAVLRPLVALDLSGKPYPALIKEIPTFKNHLLKKTGTKRQKGLSASIEILKTAKWGDGVDVTCQDLHTTWKIGLSNNVSTPDKGDFDNILDILIDKKNSKKCTIIFKKVMWDFYLHFPRPVASHLEKEIFEKNAAESQGYERNSFYVKDPANPGLYNGPYVIKEKRNGTAIILERNPAFYGEAAKIDSLVFKVIANTATVEAELLNNEIQMAATNVIPFDSLLAFQKKAEAENLKILETSAASVAQIEFNLDDAIVKDPRVRRAIDNLINRKQITEAFFQGQQAPANSFATPLDDWFVEAPREGAQRSETQALLDAVGWKLDVDGWRKKSGQKLSLTLAYVGDISLNQALVQNFQEVFKNDGIELLLKPQPARLFFAETLKKRNFQLAFYSTVSIPNSAQAARFRSDQIPAESNSWSGMNRAGWVNLKVDSLIDQVEHEFDPKARDKIMKQVIKEFRQDLPAVVIYQRANVALISNHLKNVKISGHGYTEFLQVERWQLVK